MAPDGQLKRIENSSGVFQVHHDEMGVLTSLRNESGDVIKLAYDNAGRVDRVAFDRESTATYSIGYEYDHHGLRNRSKYLEGEVAADIRFDYDIVGNLKVIDLPNEDGSRMVYEYALGSANEVLAVDASLGQGYEMGYDAVGRLSHVTRGNRQAQYEYDEYGRINGVQVDERHITWTNAHNELSSTPLSFAPRISTVFGTIDQIAYTRMRGSPYGPIVFNPNVLGFEAVTPEMYAPDAVALRSFGRRYLLARFDITDPAPLGFDKPSNLLFIPPEYASVNCYFCLGGISGVSLDASDNSVTVGQQVTFDLDANTAPCGWFYPMPGYLVPQPFNHLITFGDGGSGSSSSLNLGKTFSHAYASAGTRTAQGTISCSCSAVFIGSDTETINVCSIGLSYPWHSTNFIPTNHESRYLISVSGTSVSFHFNVFSTASSNDQNDFQSGLNMWDVSGAACGTYTSSASMNFTGSTTATLLHETVTVLSGACGDAELHSASSPFEKIRIKVGAQSCGHEIVTSAHEIGHILGFLHPPAYLNPTDIMAQAGGANRTVQPLHARTLVEQYGAP